MKVKLLVSSIGLPLAVGLIGSYFTLPGIIGWYQNLNKPFFNPPNFIFGPVWTILYILMGISFYLVLLKKGKDKLLATRFFYIQLLLNLLWSIIFFSLHNPLLALLEIIILWISIALTINYFYRISKNAAYLLIPYIVWVSFAFFLNLSIFLLNP